MCDRNRFTIRTSDEIISRIEALAGISGESKNSVANVLLAIQLGGVTCGATSKKGKGRSNTEEDQETSVVHDDGDNNSSEKSGATSEIKNKRVSSSPTPPTPSQKKKGILRIPKKEKVSSIGNGRKPRDFEECLEYFKQRRIPDPEPKAREFFDFYEAKGWVVGKSPIKKWSCCLTVWISNNPSWKPIWELTDTKSKLEDVLEWMKKEHPEWYKKFKGAKNINDIDGYYLDEFRGA